MAYHVIVIYGYILLHKLIKPLRHSLIAKTQLLSNL